MPFRLVNTFWQHWQRRYGMSLSFTPARVLHQCMPPLFGHTIVLALRVQTCIALRRIHPALALDLAPRRHIIVDPCGFQPKPCTAVRAILRRFRMPLAWMVILYPLPPPLHPSAVQLPPLPQQQHQQHHQHDIFEGSHPTSPVIELGHHTKNARQLTA